MPIIHSAIKRMRQTITRRARNLKTKRALRDSVKTFAGEKTAASLSKAQSELDKAVKKNLLPKNTAARRNAQLAKQAKEAGIKLTTTKKKAAAKPAAAKATAKKAPAKKPAAKASPKK